MITLMQVENAVNDYIYELIDDQLEKEPYYTSRLKVLVNNYSICNLDLNYTTQQLLFEVQKQDDIADINIFVRERLDEKEIKNIIHRTYKEEFEKLNEKGLELCLDAYKKTEDKSDFVIFAINHPIECATVGSFDKEPEWLIDRYKQER